MKSRLADFLASHERLASCGLDRQELEALAYAVEKEFLADFLGMMVESIEDVMSIPPTLDWKEILESGAHKIVQALGADAASIRLFDPESERMVAFGSHRFAEEERTPSISLRESIAGRVARSGRSWIVPSILDEPLYRDKSIVERLGMNSLVAVPIHIPRFLAYEPEIRGALQIYYRERYRRFDPLEITHAEVLARRISHVVARKRIIDLSELNLQKEKLVEKIFLKLSDRQGIKMRDLFRAMVPELQGIIDIRACALYAVTPDRNGALLEVSHPEEDGGGRRLVPVSEHPYMALLVDEAPEPADTESDRVDRSYVLIKNPGASPLAGPALARYMAERRYSSMLGVPLRARGRTGFFITFFTADRKQSFSDREIELLTFFAKEVMQALRIERLDDILHDIKNPAVALGGFARRARRLLEKEGAEAARDRIAQALDIVIEEAQRLEEIPTSRSIEGRERLVDAGRLLAARFRLNEEALKERGKRSVRTELDAEPGLRVLCVPFDLERALDNLLMNAAEAVDEGGFLAASARRRGGEVRIEIRNSGLLDADLAGRIRSGRMAGRGLNIVRRFAQAVGGRLDVESGSGEVLFRLALPEAAPE